MNLISCNHCGVVLNKNNVCFRYAETEEGLDEDFVGYNQHTGCWVEYVKCPVCAEKVFKEKYEIQY